jgi:hypothetical protein
VQSKVFASSSASSSSSSLTVKLVAIERTLAGTSSAAETAEWDDAVPLRSTETQWALSVVLIGHKFEF